MREHVIHHLPSSILSNPKISIFCLDEKFSAENQVFFNLPQSNPLESI